MVGSGDVAGQLSVQVCSANLDNSRIGPILLAIGEGEVVWIFNWPIISLSVLETDQKRLKYCLQAPLNAS